jgi:hypothetical protein
MLYLVLFLLGLLVGLVIVVLVLMHVHNKGQWARRGSPPVPGEPQGRAGTGACCRQDAPCSARCAQLAIAQTVAGAVEGVRHGDGLRDLIQLLECLPPGSLRGMIDAETAEPGTLSQLAVMLQAGTVDALEAGPAGASPSAP